MNNCGICTGDGERIRKCALRNSGNIPAVEACQFFWLLLLIRMLENNEKITPF